MFILINSTCFEHYYAHHQENRLCKQLHVEYAWLCWQQSCRVGTRARTCNLFLKHEVMNVGLGVDVNGQPLTGTAKWADVLKVYETDKQNVLYHLLHNRTDRHLKPFAQDAMKIRLAARVVSSTVDAHVTAGKEKCF